MGRTATLLVLCAVVLGAAHAAQEDAPPAVAPVPSVPVSVKAAQAAPAAPADDFKVTPEEKAAIAKLAPPVEVPPAVASSKSEKQVKSSAVEADESAPVNDHPAGPATEAGIHINDDTAAVVAVGMATVSGVKASGGANPLTDDDESEDADGNVHSSDDEHEEEEDSSTGNGHGLHGSAHGLQSGKHHDYAQHLESACCVVMGLVVFTLFFETTREIMEWYFHKNSMNFELRVMDRTFAEMAILGFISFVLFLIHDYKFISKMIAFTTNDNYVNVSHMLHDVHIMLFIVMLGYIACVVYVTILAKAAFRSWKKHGTPDIDLKDGLQLNEIVSIIDWILFLPFDIIFGNKLYKDHFAAVKNAFDAQPPQRWLNYKKVAILEVNGDEKQNIDNVMYVNFIKDSTQDAMLNMVELSWHVWMVFYLSAAFVYTVTIYVPDKDDSDQYVWLSIFLFCGLIPLGCALLCTIRLSWILHRFKKDAKKGAPQPIERYYFVKWERTLIQDNIQCALVFTVIYIAVYIKMFLALERISSWGLLVTAIVAPMLVFLIAPFIIPNYGLIVAASGGIAGKHDTVGGELKHNDGEGNMSSAQKKSLRHSSLGRPAAENHAV